MNIEVIKLFLKIKKTGSITAAANEAYITQSSLSKKIVSLENELGVQLFERSKGKPYVEMTNAGRDFSDIAERILLLYEQALNLKEKDNKTFLTLGCIRSAHTHILSHLLSNVTTLNPNFYISVEDHHTSEIFLLLENKRIDIGITQSAAPLNNFESSLLYKENYKIIMPKNSEVHGNTLNFEDLPVKNGIYQAFDSNFEKWYDEIWGIFSAKMRVNTTPSAEQYFTTSKDWMIVPSFVAHSMENLGFKSYNLSENLSPPQHFVYLITSKNIKNLEIIHFINIIKENFHNYSDVPQGVYIT